MRQDVAVQTVGGQAGLPFGSASSIAGHVLLLCALFWISPLRPIAVPPPLPVAVEIVTEQQFETMQRPPEARAPAPPTASALVPERSVAPAGRESSPEALAPLLPSAPKRFTATRFYSASILEEPQMARIRRTLGTFSPYERMVQLCNIEGLEQIRRAVTEYAPDTMVGYAMTDIVASGLKLSAAGGAFRSRRKWYGVAYTCTVSPDYRGVTAFEFALGEPIPEEQWEAHNLNVADADE
jgi:hypothetical protein